MAKYKIPTRWIRVERTQATIGTRSKKSGRMTGRKVVPGRGDSTYTRRLTHDVDIDGDKKPDYFSGQILGRKKVHVKSSRRAKSYEKQL